jgi:hypothetical protein
MTEHDQPPSEEPKEIDLKLLDDAHGDMELYDILIRQREIQALRTELVIEGVIPTDGRFDEAALALQALIEQKQERLTQIGYPPRGISE